MTEWVGCDVVDCPGPAQWVSPDGHHLCDMHVCDSTSNDWDQMEDAP